MSYFKKLCVLKQLSSGFAGDGKKVSGLVTVERYGSRVSLGVSLINFAPLSDGRYIAVLCDTHGTFEFYELTNTGTAKKGTSSLDVGDGFGCLICHVGLRAQPVAFGKCGDAVYDVKKMCLFIDNNEKGEKAENSSDKSAPVNLEKSKNSDACKTEESAADSDNNPPQNDGENSQDYGDTKNSSEGNGGSPQIFANSSDGENTLYDGEISAGENSLYDDEVVATENYYEYDDVDFKNLKISENKNELHPDAVADKDGESQSGETQETGGADAYENEDAQSLFKLEKFQMRERKPEYFETVKDDVADLFEKYPREENLERAVDNSKWVKIEFAPDKYYTVGVIYELGVPRYICYGVPSDDKREPPKALKGYCSYLPLSLFDLRGKGYWMMYQDADTGKCVEIESE